MILRAAVLGADVLRAVVFFLAAVFRTGLLRAVDFRAAVLRAAVLRRAVVFFAVLRTVLVPDFLEACLLAIAIAISSSNFINPSGFRLMAIGSYRYSINKRLPLHLSARLTAVAVIPILAEIGRANV